MTDLTTLEDTKFNIGFNYLKIATEGNSTFAVPSNPWTASTQAIDYTTVTIPHNLGFVPHADTFYIGSDGRMKPFPNTIPQPPSSGDSRGNGTGTFYTSVWVDDSDLILRIANNSGSDLELNIFWRIYYDQ